MGKIIVAIITTLIRKKGGINRSTRNNSNNHKIKGNRR